MDTMIDEKLLELIVCPKDKGQLHYCPDIAFYNPRLRLSYPIENGIPILLAERAQAVSDTQDEKLRQGQLTGPA